MGLTNNLGKLSNMITSTGSAVGVGTSTPGTLLQVSGSSTTYSTAFSILNTSNSKQWNFTNVGSGISGRSGNLEINNNASDILAITQTGNVLIGNTTAKWPGIIGLEINGAETILGMKNGSTSLGYVYHSGTHMYVSNEVIGSADMIFNVNGAARMRITSGGNVGIATAGFSDTRLAIYGVDGTSSNFCIVGKNSSGQDLFVVRNDGLINTGTRSLSPYNFDPGGRVMYVNSLGQMGSTSSTRESKIHINPITSVDYIMQLNPVSFYHRIQDTETRTYTDEYFNEIKYGFIADEVEKVNLDLVFYNEKEDGTKKLAGVEYMSMIAVLTKAVQELSAKVSALENKS